MSIFPVGRRDIGHPTFKPPRGALYYPLWPFAATVAETHCLPGGTHAEHRRCQHPTIVRIALCGEQRAHVHRLPGVLQLSILLPDLHGAISRFWAHRRPVFDPQCRVGRHHRDGRGALRCPGRYRGPAQVDRFCGRVHAGGDGHPLPGPQGQCRSAVRVFLGQPGTQRIGRSRCQRGRRSPTTPCKPKE